MEFTKGKTTYYIVSNIEGDLDGLYDVLLAVDFDPLDRYNVLISLGNNFGGEKTLEVYEFLRSHRTVMIEGEQERALIKFLKGYAAEEILPLIYNLNLEPVILDFARVGEKFNAKELDNYRELMLKHNPGILCWLEQMPRAVRVENYILSYAGFDGIGDLWVARPTNKPTRFIDKLPNEYNDFTFIFGKTPNNKLEERYFDKPPIWKPSSYLFQYKNFRGLNGKPEYTSILTIYSNHKLTKHNRSATLHQMIDENRKGVR